MEITQPFAMKATYGLGNSKLRKKSFLRLYVDDEMRVCNDFKKYTIS